MNVVDSSAWLEYFADGPNAAFFAPAIESTERLVVPTICLYEVFKRIAQQRDENDALQAIVQMRSATVIDLDAALATSAAVLSLRHKLPMADSIILATAQSVGGAIWTQDAHFEHLPGVKFRAKSK